MTKKYTALGMMSGTSMDGVDIALLETDGEVVFSFGAHATYPYDDELRAAVTSVLGGKGDVARAEDLVTLAHGRAVERFLQDFALKAEELDVAGFHGQTILHDPDNARTWQIGDGARLAGMIGMDVVNDFRSADMAAGGQGAPLAPLYHTALARELEKPVAVLNIGGVANVTWIGGEGDILAFDTGPGNALMDDWITRHTGGRMDEDGALASAGEVDRAWLSRALAQPYFDAPPPKSLDRNDFAHVTLGDQNPADGAASLAAFTAASIARARDFFPAPVTAWYICGGGRHNPFLMGLLREALQAPVEPVESLGWRGDALEAEAFAFLAVRSLRGLPLSLPTTTGVAQPTSGGVLHKNRG